MPAYSSYTTQLANPTLQAVPGLPVYVYGGLNWTVARTRMTVTAVQLTSPNAVVTGTVIEGQVPVVGQLVTITGAVPTYFNVTGATISAVSSAATPDVGVYSITFSLTNSNIATTASPGLAVAPQIESSETCVNGSSIAVAIQNNTPSTDSRSLRADVSFPTDPAAVTVDLYTAQYDIDSEYQYLANVLTFTGGVASPSDPGSVVVPGVTANFARLKVSSLGAAVGVTPKIIGKISVT